MSNRNNVSPEERKLVRRIIGVTLWTISSLLNARAEVYRDDSFINRMRDGTPEQREFCRELMDKSHGQVYLNPVPSFLAIVTPLSPLFYNRLECYSNR
ncbi:MAG: hypothetical protein AABW89_04650 [Nanoarchaeota archaeon]